MTTPISFPSTTARFNLPLLISGQAQKEFFLNQALAMIDCIAQFAVESAIDTPPPSPAEGDCFRVVQNATGTWEGHDDQIAIWIAGAWHFLDPADGMMIFDRSEGQFSYYAGGWDQAANPSRPTGGSTVDQEARASIGQLIDALQKSGVFGGST